MRKDRLVTALDATVPPIAFTLVTDVLYSLAAVNACLFCVGLIQCSRILNYQREQTGSYSNAFSAMFGSVKDAAKDAEKEVEKEAHKATA